MTKELMGFSNYRVKILLDLVNLVHYSHDVRIHIAGTDEPNSAQQAKQEA